MAAKLLHSLTDDNPELQKQIGCMTGILQLFDRQPMLTGGRHIVGHSSRRIPPGHSHVNGRSSESESNSAHVKLTSMEKYSHKNVKDRRRVSTESSRPSFSSSSHSSSLSSPAQLEQASFDRMILPEPPPVEPAMILQHPSPQHSRQTIFIRDLVKDSMQREIQGLSIKAKTVEEAVVSVVKYRDSPRLPSKISEDSHGSDLDHQRRKTPADLKESLRALAKLQEVPKNRNEPSELSRSSSYQPKGGLLFSISRDTPRFSYDGREVPRAQFDSGDGSKSSLKLKDLPRLSLDSRECSMQSMNADTKSNLSSVLNGTFQNQQQVPGIQARPPSVVAKLMGLEALPYSIPSSDTTTVSSQSYLGEGFANIAGVEKVNQMKPVELTSPAKNLWKEPSSPRWKNTDSSVIPMSRFPIEPAPWKQNDGSKGGSPKPASRNARVSTKAPTVFPSVYCEIEKRFKDLEFTQSGKDLRALKQILEAMQAKGLIETPKEGQDLCLSSCEDHEDILINSLGSVDKQQIQTGQVLAQTKKRIISAQTQESPIVIMKPMKCVEKSGAPSSVIPIDGVSDLSKLHSCESVDNRKGLNSERATKDVTSKPSQRVNVSNSTNTRGDKSLKIIQSSTRSNQFVKEGNVVSGSKSSGSISPRMQLKRRPPTSPDSSKPTRQSNESNSPEGRRKSTSQIYQKNDDSVGSRNLASAQPNSSIVQSTRNAQRNCEVSRRISSVASPSMKASEFMLSDLVEKSKPVLCEGESGYVPPEYSSPVSVLENMMRKEDSASPVKFVVDASACDERNANSTQHIPTESFVSSSGSGAAFEINRKKLQNINDLVQKLRRINSSHDEAQTDYIASLCDNTDPDHRNVSEILLASGLLLRDIADFQFHPSGHPINPELFLVLEQTKTSNEACIRRKKSLSSVCKIHRKLIFDVVNEILARKLVPSGPHSEHWIFPVKLVKKSLNAQKLLRELCHEIDGLRWMNPKFSSDKESDDDGWKFILCKDVHLAESWMDLKAETSGAVLDIERSIFRDLVNEIVNGESTDLMSKPGGHRLTLN